MTLADVDERLDLLGCGLILRWQFGFLGRSRQTANHVFETSVRQGQEARLWGHDPKGTRHARGQAHGLPSAQCVNVIAYLQPQLTVEHVEALFLVMVDVQRNGKVLCHVMFDQRDAIRCVRFGQQDREMRGGEPEVLSHDEGCRSGGDAILVFRHSGDKLNNRPSLSNRSFR